MYDVTNETTGREPLDTLVKLAGKCESGTHEERRAAGRKFGEILDAEWRRTESDDECELLIADVEFLTGFHYVWP